MSSLCECWTWRGAFTQVRMCLHGADVKRSLHASEEGAFSQRECVRASSGHRDKTKFMLSVTKTMVAVFVCPVSRVFLIE